MTTVTGRCYARTLVGFAAPAGQSRTIAGGLSARPMTPLSAFGLFAVTLMVVFYALERRSPWFVLAFAGACILGSIYGFLQGAWPFGLVEAVWSLIAVRRWWSQRHALEVHIR